MKRLICLLFCFLLLSGCSVIGEHFKEPVTFYYVRDGFEKDMSPVIDSEVREASGHSKDLPYLLALYSMGPSEEDLTSILPRNTKIYLRDHTEEGIILSMSDEAMSLSDSDFTLASTCLALTCTNLMDAPQITVICSDRSINIRTDNLLLHHNLIENVQEDIK